MSNEIMPIAKIIAEDDSNYTWRIINPNGDVWEVLIPIEKPSVGDGPFGLNFVTRGHYE